MPHRFEKFSQALRQSIFFLALLLKITFKSLQFATNF